MKKIFPWTEYFRDTATSKKYHWVYFLFLFLCFTSVKLHAQSIEYATENVKFYSKDVNLVGTIYKPKNPIAALVLVHGSGKEVRMREFSELMARNGIAVLSYDKRGVGESEGTYVGPEVGTNNVDSANLNLLAEDVSAAVNYFKRYLKNNKIKIGLAGFSQAGWIIPIAASKNQTVAFMVNFSGAVVSTLEQLRFQFYTEGNSNFWNTHSEDDAREHTLNDADRYQFVGTDPVEALSKVKVPGLWLFGAKDVQVPVHLSIEHLNGLKAQGKDFDYILFPSLGHNLTFSKTLESQNVLEITLLWIKQKSTRLN